MSSSKARKLLFFSSGGDDWCSKMLSRREDGRELWEFTDLSTGDTKAIQIRYPDGRMATSIILHDYTKDFEGCYDSD